MGSSGGKFWEEVLGEGSEGKFWQEVLGESSGGNFWWPVLEGSSGRNGVNIKKRKKKQINISLWKKRLTLMNVTLQFEVSMPENWEVLT